MKPFRFTCKLRYARFAAFGLLAALLITVAPSSDIHSQGGFPLPIPTNVEITSLDDFRGTLFRTPDGDFQIESITWLVDDEYGSLEIHAFAGYDQAGERIEFSHGDHPGRLVASVDDFHDYFLWEAPGGTPAIRVDWLRWGTNSNGFLSALSLYGVQLATGDAIAFDREPTQSCHPVYTYYCWRTTCRMACGPTPDCRCGDVNPIGYCVPLSSHVCEGGCPSGSTCAWRVSGCVCEPTNPVEQSTWGAVKALFD